MMCWKSKASLPSSVSYWLINNHSDSSSKNQAIFLYSISSYVFAFLLINSVIQQHNFTIFESGIEPKEWQSQATSSKFHLHPTSQNGPTPLSRYGNYGALKKGTPLHMVADECSQQSPISIKY